MASYARCCASAVVLPRAQTLSTRPPSVRVRLPSALVPAWALWIVRFQVAVPYVYGGLAKLNGDWLAGEPIRSWLIARSAQSVVGPWLAQEWLVFTICYGGLVFDEGVTGQLLQ